MVMINRIKGATAEEVTEKVGKKLLSLGYSNFTSPKTKTSINISNIRLSYDYIKKYGRNLNPYSNRRGNVLGWKNWVEVNNAINDVLDSLKVSANVKSLHGKFKIREGTKRFTEEDWEDIAYDNVGSFMQPVFRKDAWLPEYPERLRKKLKEII